ncbi:MAG: SIS domain-containing protein [Candidatus Hydrogenedentota bacterium]
MSAGPSDEQRLIGELNARRPDLEGCIPALEAAYRALRDTFSAGGKLLTCGNGGSCADAMHIVGELCKSFERKRPLPPAVAARLSQEPGGEELARCLETGLPALTLGLNGALKSAVENDSALPEMAYAQEAHALLKPGDALLAISTSGNARNCLLAMAVARAAGARAIALTGPHGGAMAQRADYPIKAPGDSVKTIQEAHIALYHTLCALVEAAFFPDVP